MRKFKDVSKDPTVQDFLKKKTRFTHHLDPESKCIRKLTKEESAEKIAAYDRIELVGTNCTGGVKNSYIFRCRISAPGINSWGFFIGHPGKEFKKKCNCK